MNQRVTLDATHLQAVHQVGKRFRKVVFQSQRLRVRRDGGVVSRSVLVRRRQVGVRLWELWLQPRHVLVASDGLHQPALCVCKSG